MPALRSRGSSRGSIVGPDNQIRVYESFLEARAMLVLMSRSDVAQIREQQRVDYVDAKGNRRYHVFDFVVTKTDGTRIAVAVKPSQRAEKIGLAAMLKDIAKRIPKRFAHRVALMTERDFSRIDVFNGEVRLAALHAPATGADAAACEFVARMTGAMTIGAIAAACGHAGAGFWAVVKLIARGVLAVVDKCRITTRAVVRVAAQREDR